MSDHVLTCEEVCAFFATAVTPGSTGGLVSEGAQNAFVNLYTRLAAHCPAGDCTQRPDCVLHVEGRPKIFDGDDGKVRFLRMKVRTEGRRLHRRDGADVLMSGRVDLVGEDDWRLGTGTSADWMDALAVAAQRDAALDDRLRGLRDRIAALDLRTVRGGHENVAVAVAAVGRLVDLSASHPVPDRPEARRDAVRAVFDELAPGIGSASAAAVRQRQKRLRDIVRHLLESVDGGWFAEIWVPVEDAKRR